MSEPPKIEGWSEGCSKVFEELYRINTYGVSTDIDSTYSDQLHIKMIDDFDELNIDSATDHPEPSVQRHLLSRYIKYRAAYYKRIPTNKVCPYCKQTVNKTSRKRHEYDDGLSGYHFVLESCPNCAYWRWTNIETRWHPRWGINAVLYSTFLGKMREFPENLPDGVPAEIASWIRRNPANLHSITPKGLEKLVVDVFKSNYDHADVTHIGRPDDGGVDVLFIDSNSEQWLIQVKRREKPTSTESVATIRNLLGTMLLEDSSCGIVVSTADHFSYQAYKAVHRASERGMVVKLIDKHLLNRMLTLVLPERPWLSSIKRSFPYFTDYLMQKTPGNHYRQLKLFELTK